MAFEQDTTGCGYRVSLLEHQLPLIHQQMSDITQTLADLGNGVQQLNLQFTMQRQQQHEEMLRLMTAQGVTLFMQPPNACPVAASAAPPKKIRPGPRERLRLRQAQGQPEPEWHEVQELGEPSQAPLGEPEPEQVSTSSTELVREDATQDCNASAMSELSGVPSVEYSTEPSMQVSRVSTPETFAELATEDSFCHAADPPLKTSSDVFDLFSMSPAPRCRCSAVAVPFLLPLFGAFAFLSMSVAVLLGGFGANEAVLDFSPENRQLSVTAGNNAVAIDAVSLRRMRELGHLHLTVSDCEGAERWFTKALGWLETAPKTTTANLSAFTRERFRVELIGDRGFALVCALRFRDGAEVLKQALGLIGGASPPHLANALGYAHFRLAEYDLAKEVFKAAVQTSHGKQNPILWSNLGAASMSSGDILTADDALYYAMSGAGKLKATSDGYYNSVVVNNIRVLERRTAGQHDGQPMVELFNCLAHEFSSMVKSTGEEQFQLGFEKMLTGVTEAAPDSEVSVQRNSIESNGKQALNEGSIAEKFFISGEKEISNPSADSAKLLGARSAVLSLELEPLFCPF
jgi:hypothetical protein